MNQLTIPVAATEAARRKIQNVADSSRALQASLAAFEGEAKGMFRTYLCLGMHRDPAAPGGLKTFRMMAADLGDICAFSTIRKWLLEIDPELHAEIAAAHPCTR